MKFVELNRIFSFLQEVTAENSGFNLFSRGFGARPFAQTIGWNDLHPYWRVVLLAEALCGKTEEFRNQANILVTDGKAAFYVRIEELVDQGFTDSLKPSEHELFTQWSNGIDEAWFFLDSVDEARLNRKNFETALKRLSRDLKHSLNRAHIFISCRVSDWRGTEDADTVLRILPYRDSPLTTPPIVNVDSLLLDPIFATKNSKSDSQKNENRSKLYEVALVQLEPLSQQQCHLFAGAVGVIDIHRFMDEIRRMGLEDFSERPGDLLSLITYWNDHQRFDKLALVVKYNIQQKVKEDANRFDSDKLSPEKAIEGAERLAAALTFCKTFTIKTVPNDLQFHASAGALDSAAVLSDWTDAERMTLLRRGIFVPAAFGQIRFHHRSTQEYLAAQWLNRLLNTNCPLQEVWNCIFAEQYGIETVVPSLRPVIAWLALWQPLIRDEIIRRDPVLLLQYGDPRSLHISVRKELLRSYATKHASCEISDDRIDHRAMWLFADKELAQVIRDAWHRNTYEEFRWKLLSLIEDASISECTDLAREIACDTNVNVYIRKIAIDALKSCDDQEGLAQVAEMIKQPSDQTNIKLASRFSTLFPKHLSVQDVMNFVKDAKIIRENDGFYHAIVSLYDCCPDSATRIEFITGLTDLCLSPPFLAPYHRISQQHHELTEHLLHIAQTELQMWVGHEPPKYLIRLLMALERAEHYDYRTSASEDSLEILVQSDQKLQRELFWADVEEHHTNEPKERHTPWSWQMISHRQAMWRLGESALSWLIDDILKNNDHHKRRIALHAASVIVKAFPNIQDEQAHLEEMVRQDAVLVADLNGYFQPRIECAEDVKWNHEHKKTIQRQNKQKEEEKESWKRFRNKLQKDPDQLRNNRNPPLYYLMNLTEWLSRRTDQQYHDAVLAWTLLAEGFNSSSVAEAYRDGMKAMWSVTEPAEHPQKDSNGITHTRWDTILSFCGIGIESAEDTLWATRLSDQEAKRAASHSCWAKQAYPNWINDLIISHPHVVVPLVKQEIQMEWLSASDEWAIFLNAYADDSCTLQPTLEPVLLEIIMGQEPHDINKLGHGWRIIRRLRLNDDQRQYLIAIGRSRLASYFTTDQEDYVLQYLQLLFLVDTENAVDDLATWISQARPEQQKVRAEKAFSILFDRHYSILYEAISNASIIILEKLLNLAYGYVHPDDDNVHDGIFSPDIRDNAESARSSLFSILSGKSGLESYLAMQRLAGRMGTGHQRNYLELARRKAEIDSEPSSWNASEIVAFERKHTAPVKTGKDLLLVVIATLQDIQTQLLRGDASSRSLLKRAESEEEVQNWVAEQMNLRSKGRFHVHREPQVADNNKPDLIASATSASFEVAIEIKHGNKDWTIRQLQGALCHQLAENYLQPASRRHGILLISYHQTKKWTHPESKKKLSFDDVVQILNDQAIKLTNNQSGSIEVRCMSIDATKHSVHSVAQ